MEPASPAAGWAGVRLRGFCARLEPRGNPDNSTLFLRRIRKLIRSRLDALVAKLLDGRRSASARPGGVQRAMFVKRDSTFSCQNLKAGLYFPDGRNTTAPAAARVSEPDG